ncbi:helix-turn-helix transcriptional regulator [Ensifer sp.]|uniref:helix-turn-helix domain-containing protein n=1 Tax=Ensifer sp. TaxID=1872086 RepID=UPI002E150C20|nr:helix-turn-helix transcriptional regulator [Ensifer sp.]
MADDLRICALPLGRRLRRFRRLRQIKQEALAADLGVSQGMLSRWEAGVHEPSTETRTRIEALLQRHESAGIDDTLHRLVEEAPFPVHLVCDDSHVLLSASPARQAQWRVSAASFRGVSLWRYATPEIIECELALPDLGWFDDAASGSVEFATCGSNDAEMPIPPSTVRWERIGISGGRVGRLVTTVGLL